MAESPTPDTAQQELSPEPARLPLLGACGCGPSCGCGCQSGSPCRCGASCGSAGR
ncbi:hypothetical protein [Streptomyces sp. NPDC050560]|uniref:hypothetical protein n=1 Tax=Streptomyces sp. NPDC050560 TaxID=3365630 RepID=UPI00378770FC